MVNLDMITHVCICGSRMWKLDWVMFEDYEISAYSISMSCAVCGAVAKAPTLIDKPDDDSGQPAYC